MAELSTYSGVWTLAEATAGHVASVSYELLSRGRTLADKRQAKLTAVLLCHGLSDADVQELIERGADEVLLIDAPELEHFTVEPFAATLLALIERHKPEIVIAGATTTGRTLMPYVAIQAKTGLTADCTALDIDAETGNLLQTRPAIGGNIMATIATPTARPQMATVRPRSTRPPERQAGRKGKVTREQAGTTLTSRVRRVDFIRESDTHTLSEAERVVAVGRGIKKAENIAMIVGLAEALDAAVGASRDVVDRGWLEYPHQVGLSGKTVSPKLYVAVGISGAIQHLAGMQTADTVVAINSDPDAQIFRVANIGVVGDLFLVVPLLTQRLKEIKQQGIGRRT